MAMRIFASMVAVWFGFITIQPLYGDPCPHHQPALAELAAGLGAHSGAGHLMPAHGTDAGHMMAGTAGHEDHGVDHSCHCVGDCCSAAPVAMLPPATAWIPATIARRVSLQASAPVAQLPHTTAPHTLPFATAPPRVPLA